MTLKFKEGDKVKDTDKEQLWEVVGNKYRLIKLPFSLLGNGKRTKREYTGYVVCKRNDESGGIVEEDFHQDTILKV